MRRLRRYNERAPLVLPYQLLALRVTRHGATAQHLPRTSMRVCTITVSAMRNMLLTLRAQNKKTCRTSSSAIARPRCHISIRILPHMRLAFDRHEFQSVEHELNGRASPSFVCVQSPVRSVLHARHTDTRTRVSPLVRSVAWRVAPRRRLASGSPWTRRESTRACFVFEARGGSPACLSRSVTRLNGIEFVPFMRD